MRFSTKTTYGLRALMNLAKKSDGKNLSLAEIARTEKISPKYLERIFSDLKKNNLLVAEKGLNGGYRLSRPAGEITIYDIVEILEGDMALFYCLDGKGKIYCGNKCHCAVTAVLGKVQNAIAETLKKIKLADLG